MPKSKLSEVFSKPQLAPSSSSSPVDAVADVAAVAAVADVANVADVADDDPPLPPKKSVPMSQSILAPPTQHSTPVRSTPVRRLSLDLGSSQKSIVRQQSLREICQDTQDSVQSTQVFTRERGKQNDDELNVDDSFSMTQDITSNNRSVPSLFKKPSPNWKKTVALSKLIDSERNFLSDLESKLESTVSFF